MWSLFFSRSPAEIPGVLSFSSTQRQSWTLPAMSFKWRVDIHKRLSIRDMRSHDSMDDSIEIHTPDDCLQAPSIKKKSDGSTWLKDGSARKDKSATSSKRPHDSGKTISSSVSVVVRPSRSDDPSRARGFDHHRRQNDDRRHQDHHGGSSRCHGSPRTKSARLHSLRRHEISERARPLSTSGSSSSKSRHNADSKAPLGLAMVDHRSLHSQSSRATLDHRSLPSQHHSRQHDVDSTDHLGSPHVSKKEIALKTTSSPNHPGSKQMEQRTITVIQSTVEPASSEEPARSEDSAMAVNLVSLVEQARSADPAKVANVARNADSARAADSARIADLAWTADLARFADPARDAIPAAVHNPSWFGYPSTRVDGSGSSN